MVDFLGLQIRSPFGFPSGVIATNADTARWMFQNVPQIGFFISKSVTLEPREGNPEDILAAPSPKTLQNAVGLANPGLEAMVREMRELGNSVPRGVALVAQIGESTEDGFARCAKAFDEAGDSVYALELNLSCPHAEKGGILIGAHPDSVTAMVAAARSRTKKPIIAKLNAQAPNLEAVARAALGAGANALSAINTLGGANPELYNTYGGISGGPLFPVLLKTLERLKTSFNTPLIASGGIRGASDIKKIKPFTDLCCIGSALMGLDSLSIQRYFSLLEKDLKEGTDEAILELLDDVSMDYEPRIIRKTTNIGTELKRITFYGGFEAEPGQFVFVKPDNRHAKPYSVANDDPFEILVKRTGCTSGMLYDAPVHAVLKVRGPYGKGLSEIITDNTAAEDNAEDNGLWLVGAGCGIAPIHLAAQKLPGKKTILIGAKTAGDLAFTEELRGFGRLLCAAEDGSGDFHGTLADLISSMLGEGGYPRPGWIVNCGPEGFLAAADGAERPHLSPDRIIHIPERMTSCGVGICGKCSTPEGLRLCVDGPGFRADVFTPGLYSRNKAGGRTDMNAGKPI